MWFVYVVDNQDNFTLVKICETGIELENALETLKASLTVLKNPDLMIAFSFDDSDCGGKIL